MSIEGRYNLTVEKHIPAYERIYRWALTGFLWVAALAFISLGELAFHRASYAVMAFYVVLAAVIFMASDYVRPPRIVKYVLEDRAT